MLRGSLSGLAILMILTVDLLTVTSHGMPFDTERGERESLGQYWSIQGPGFAIEKQLPGASVVRSRAGVTL